MKNKNAHKTVAAEFNVEGKSRDFISDTSEKSLEFNSNKSIAVASAPTQVADLHVSVSSALNP